MEDFNILEFFHYYWNKILFVILFMCIGFLGSYIYTFNTQIPIYKSDTSLVLTKNENNAITQNDITLNKNLIATYREIIKSRRILERVINNLNLEITYDDLSENVQVENNNTTEMLIISVYNENNRLAKTIADEIASVFKEEIVEIYSIENVSIVDKALISDKPYNVHVLKQFLIGIGLGFFLSSAIITIFYLLDDTVKTEEDIEKKIGLAVLGTVPKLPKKK